MLDNYGYRHTLRICNTALTRQQWLRERASLLRYTYVACLVNSVNLCGGPPPQTPGSCTTQPLYLVVQPALFNNQSLILPASKHPSKCRSPYVILRFVTQSLVSLSLTLWPCNLLALQVSSCLIRLAVRVEPPDFALELMRLTQIICLTMTNQLHLPFCYMCNATKITDKFHCNRSYT
jgi:hypothetical protein